MMTKEQESDDFCVTTPEQIKSFFTYAQWFHQKLLDLQTPNVKQNTLFTPDILLPLPDWFESEPIDIEIEPIAERIATINGLIADAKEETSKRSALSRNNGHNRGN